MIDVLESARDDRDLTIGVVDPQDPVAMADVVALLERLELSIDDDAELFVTARRDGRLVGCLGLAGCVVKCAGCDPHEQGTGVAARVMERMNYEALDRGRGHLFAYTKPHNREIFESLGFTFLAQVEHAVLLENTPFGISGFCRHLSEHYRHGRRIGGVVVNCNPFTLGHRSLIERAAAEVDVLHVFVVAEDASLFPADVRLCLVREGVAELNLGPRVAVHSGSHYTVSRATFPRYFLPGDQQVSAAAGLDLQLFRAYLAPTLGITERFVGTEPLSGVTASYNREMRFWLTDAPLAHPAITVHELPRAELGGQPISASRVRAAIQRRDADAVRSLVPDPTFDYISRHFFSGAAA